MTFERCTIEIATIGAGGGGGGGGGSRRRRLGCQREQRARSRVFSIVQAIKLALEEAEDARRDAVASAARAQSQAVAVRRRAVRIRRRIGAEQPQQSTVRLLLRCDVGVAAVDKNDDAAVGAAATPPPILT